MQGLVLKPRRAGAPLSLFMAASSCWSGDPEAAAVAVVWSGAFRQGLGGRPARGATAHYTNMPPGEYSFQVIAANSYGIWNDRGASVRFVLRPHLYQTSWFYVFCAGILWQCCGGPTSYGSANCGENSMCGLGSASTSAGASRANSTTRFCRAFRA